MATYNIGIDFGTSQTKICSLNIFDNPLDRKYIFHKFYANDNYLLPSTIKLNNNATCAFGLNEPKLMRYFKMKALYDDIPHYQIVNRKAFGDQITQGELDTYPEICCILYLAHCILDVKESFRKPLTKTINILGNKVEQKETIEIKPKQNLFSKLFGKKKPGIPIKSQEILSDSNSNIPEVNNYFFTIGIPTEYDFTIENRKRRSKQYEMLYLALQLADELKVRKALEEKSIQFLLDNIETNYEKIKKENDLTETFYEKRGLYVIAESTAGIVPLHDRLQRELDTLPDTNQAMQQFRDNNLGNYITMDVGAGTTDISFFNFSSNSGQIRMKYFASRSIPEASNFLIFRYLNSRNPEDLINFDVKAIDNDKWTDAQKDFRTHLFNIVRDPFINLYYRVNIIFQNKPRQYWHYENVVAKGCKVYGGGSRFEEFNRGILLLHNGGVQIHAPNLETYTQLQKFINPSEFNLNLAYPNGMLIEKSGNEYENIMPLLDILNTALGLAMVNFKNRPDGENGWIEIVTLPDDPINSDNGMAMYDIFNRDWID